MDVKKLEENALKLRICFYHDLKSACFTGCIGMGLFLLMRQLCVQLQSDSCEIESVNNIIKYNVSRAPRTNVVERLAIDCNAKTEHV